MKKRNIFLILAIVGLIDVVSRGPLNSADEGIVAFGIGAAFAFLFGVSAGTFIIISIGIACSFWILWAALAWYFNKKLAKPSPHGHINIPPQG